MTGYIHPDMRNALMERLFDLLGPIQKFQLGEVEAVEAAQAALIRMLTSERKILRQGLRSIGATDPQAKNFIALVIDGVRITRYEYAADSDYYYFMQAVDFWYQILFKEYVDLSVGHIASCDSEKKIYRDKRGNTVFSGRDNPMFSSRINWPAWDSAELARDMIKRTDEAHRRQKELFG